MGWTSLFINRPKDALNYFDQCLGISEKEFPPSYLKTHASVKYLIVATLALYLLAMIAGTVSITPREYKRHAHNQTMNAKEFQKILDRKIKFANIDGVCFWLASLTLAVLVGRIVLSP